MELAEAAAACDEEEAFCLVVSCRELATRAAEAEDDVAVGAEMIALEEVVAVPGVPVLTTEVEEGTVLCKFAVPVAPVLVVLVL